MLLYLEITANALNAASIALAAMNSRYTWPVGIVGCLLFLVLFMQSQLYADALLQMFFTGTSIAGWRSWTQHAGRAALPVSHVRLRQLLVQVGLACAVCAAYGALLHAYTDAYSPYADSAVLAFSVLAQLLLMRRHYEAWWGWLLVNSIAVPLFWSRGLHITAILYAGFWINALVALVRWRDLVIRA